MLVPFPFPHPEPYVSSVRAIESSIYRRIWPERGVSCQLIYPLDSGKRRPPWPAVLPAESTDAMARAEGPAMPGPMPGLLEPKQEPGGLAGKVQRPAAILSFQSRVCLLCSRGCLGHPRKQNGETGAKFLLLILSCGFVLCCQIKTNGQ